MNHREQLAMIARVPMAIAFQSVMVDDAAVALWEGKLPLMERALLGPGATLRRKKEFYAGRQAARRAIELLFVRNGLEVPKQLAILRNEGARAGEPYPVGANGQWLGVYVSISHADGLAVAAAGWERVGIDLVTMESYGEAFIEEAFAPGELDAWSRWLGERSRSERVVCAAFAAKEAAVKYLGCGLSVPLRSVRVIPRGNELNANAGRFAATLWHDGRAMCMDGAVSFGPRRLWLALWGTGLPSSVP